MSTQTRPHKHPERKYIRGTMMRDGRFHRKLARLVERHRGGLSDTQIAMRAGISNEHLSRLLNGHHSDVRLSTLEAILQAVGATLRDYHEA